MRSDHKIILVSVVFGILFWLLDSVLDHYFYYEGSVQELMITDIPPHELYVRSMVIILFLISGIILSQMIKRLNTISTGLDEKVKELECLYQISEIIGENHPIEDTLKRIANSIISTWQYLDLTGVRIVMGEMHVRSDRFTETGVRLSQNIVVNGWHAGFIEVCYSEENAEAGENCLLDEEKSLLNIIAESIGQFSIRKRSEQELMESATELRALVNTIPDLVSLKDENGIYIECNPKYERFIGAKKEDIIGKNDYELLDRELADAFNEQEKAVLEKGEISVDEKDIIYADGGKREIVEIIRAPIYTPKGSLMGLLFIGRDVTIRKETELGLFKDKELAEESSEVKGRFLANMSHELRTPLSSIIGFSDILAERNFGELNDEQSKFVQNIRTSGEHLLELINNILDNSKIESGQMEFEPDRFFPKELIEEVFSLIEPVSETRSIELRSDVDLDGVEIYADRIKMKQIMYNLLSNAIKFTPENGRIDISSKLLDENIQISISDTGIGIPSDKQHTIFEPYKQATSSSNGHYKGTGLGLAIVKQFVEMHGGQITVESEEGKGSTFVFTIPVKM